MRENVYQDLNQHLLLLQKKQIEEKVGLELEKGELERGEKLKEERERKEEKEKCWHLQFAKGNPDRSEPTPSFTRAPEPNR